MKDIKKYIIIIFIIAILLLVINGESVYGYTYTNASYALQIINKIPSTVTVDLKEIEFEKAEGAIKTKLNEILSAYDADFDVVLNSSSGSIKKARVLLYYNNSSRNYSMPKNISVNYSNSESYNEADKNYVNEQTKNLSLSVEYKYDVSANGTSSAYSTWNSDVKINWDSIHNIASVKAVGVFIPKSTAPSSNVNYALNFDMNSSKNYYVYLFKNDVCYKVMQGNVKYMPVITIPDSIKETDEAYIEKASPIILNMLKQAVKDEYTDGRDKIKYSCSPIIKNVNRKSEISLDFTVNYDIERTSMLDSSKSTETGGVFYVRIAKNGEYRAKTIPTILGIEIIMKNSKPYVKMKFNIVQNRTGSNETILSSNLPKVFLVKEGNNINIDTNIQKDATEKDVYYFEIDAEKLYSKSYGEYTIVVKHTDKNNKYPQENIVIKNSISKKEAQNGTLIYLKDNKLRIDKLTTLTFDSNAVEELCGSNKFEEVKLENIKYYSKTDKTVTFTDEQIENVKYLNIGKELYTEKDLNNLKVFKNVEYILVDLYSINKAYSADYITEYSRYLQFIATNFENIKGLMLSFENEKTFNLDKIEGFKYIASLSNLEILKINKSYKVPAHIGSVSASDFESVNMMLNEKFDMNYLRNLQQLKKLSLIDVKIKNDDISPIVMNSKLEDVTIDCFYTSKILDITVINSLKNLKSFVIDTNNRNININVNTKNYIMPFNYIKSLDLLNNSLVDERGPIDLQHDIVYPTLKVTGGTLSEDEKAVIFPVSAKKGDTVNLNYGMANIIITYMGEDYKYPDGSYVLGDVNSDGKVDVNDAILILKKITGKTTLTASQIGAADVTKDTKVDVQDAILILKYIVGKIKSF
ncbi:MAG: dockerin type I repeat-containing protein [Clostridia bacterium]|nr:dockerin type I repeat-containing protein [Clostridia bacterium]